MESGRWVDGRYELYEPLADWAPDDTDAGRDLAEPGPQAISWAGGGSGLPATDSRGAELALATAGSEGTVAVPADDGVAASSPDAQLRVMAGVLMPLAAFLVVAGVAVLVREGPTAVAAAGGPLAPAPTREAPAPLPPLHDFGPLEFPQLPVAPVTGEPTAAAVPVEPERAARTSVAAARRVTAGSQAAPSTSTRSAPSSTAAGPPAPTEQGPAGPPAEQEPAEPGPLDPGPVGPVPAEPGPNEPGPADPGPADPGPNQPGPSEPNPNQPDPNEPTEPGPGEPPLP